MDNLDIIKKLNLDNSILLDSIKEKLNPQNDDEKYEIIHTGISGELASVDLYRKIQEFDNQGYHTVKFLRNEKGIQLLELTKDKTEDEVLAHRLFRVEYKLLRWFKDGKRKFDLILKDKKYSLSLFEKRMTCLTSRGLPIPREMVDNYNKKKQRIAIYQEKVDKLDDFINNYRSYKYSELNSAVDSLFKTKF